MTKGDSASHSLSAIYAEIACIKLILGALLAGSLPSERAERHAEIEAIVSMIEAAARRSVVIGADADQTKIVMNAAENLAVGFVRGLRGPS